jgi:hypothetical protein
MKWLLSVTVLMLALPACTTVAALTTLERAAMGESRATLGAISIAADELRATERMEVSDALRM